MIAVEFRKLEEGAVTPSYAREGDAGLDLTAISFYYDYITDTCIYGTGIAVKIPEGYVGLIFPRSSIYKKSMELSNSVGVIDSSYIGEIKFMMKRRDKYYGHIYGVGERIGQLIIIPYPKIILKEVDILPSTERGEKGFGSTDNVEKKE